MGKKIGNMQIFVVLIGLTGFIQAEPTITCSVIDSNGKQLKQAQVNIPFMVQVVVADTQQRKLPTPSIKGLDQFTVKSTRSQTGTTIYNQDVTVTQTYFVTVVANTEGDYKIGPAFVEIDGALLSTKPLTIKVGEQQKTNTQDASVFLEMSFDKMEEVYVGQPITLKVSFYYTDPMLRLAEINQPTFEGFTLSKLEGPVTGTKVINQEQYRYLQWTAQVMPEQSGILKITPTEALYMLPTKRGQSFGLFDDFNSFFSSINQQVQKAYSNALELNVLPIPEHTPPVTAVGAFSSYTAKLNNHKAGKGEATVLTLEVIGSGNIEQLKHPQLILPENLTFYESTASVTKLEKGYKKSFEYIIQGSQTGTYTLDPQVFTFFNPKEKTFNDLKTESLTITIEALVQKALVEQASSSTPEITQSVLIKQGAWKKNKESDISLLLFMTAFFIPVLLLAIVVFKQRRTAYLLRNAPELRYQNAFKQARNALSKARIGCYDVQVYHIFIELFAARLKKTPSEISEELIEATLCKANIKPEDLIKWRLLFAHMTEQAFSSYGTQERNDGLFNQAFYWLSQLEKLL